LVSVLAISYLLAALILVCWMSGLDMIDLGPVGGWLFWPLHVAWLASVVFAFFRFRRRGAWTLPGLILILPGPVFLGMLFYACAVDGACV
jgi:hypothetical protein